MTAAEKTEKTEKRNGGARPGAGRKKGGKNASTISKEQARDALAALVKEALRPMAEAQIASAQGIKYLVLRSKATGRFLRRYQMGEPINADTEIIEVWEKEPSTPAFTDLMNRTIGKPAEHVDLTVTPPEKMSDEDLRALATALLDRL